VFVCKLAQPSVLEALRLPAAPQYCPLSSDCSPFGAEAVWFFLLRSGVAELDCWQKYNK